MDTNSIRHLGPVAQDFHTAFGLNGADDKHISTVDEGGVALAAIQGLNQKGEKQAAQLHEKDAKLRELKTRLEHLERLINGADELRDKTARDTFCYFVAATGIKPDEPGIQ